MGGLAAIVRFDDVPVERQLFQRLLVGLGAPSVAARRAPTQTPGIEMALVPRAFARESLDFATAPPDGSGRLWLAFDGRVDNRDDLESRLGAALPRDRRLSDAELVLAGFSAWGETLFDRLVGPFAVALIDSAACSIRLARDPLGGRSLFYRRSGAQVAVASRSSALAEADAATLRPDEESIVRYLAVEGPRPGSTFFDGVRAVRPGELIQLDATGTASRTVATLVPAELPGRATDADFERLFRERLDEAVACRLPESSRSAILMSGGLDSTAIAASAVRAAARAALPAPITVSWVFDELHENDERRWISAASRATGLRSLQFAADQMWPLSDEPSWPRSTESPFLDLYWRLLDRSLLIARDEECPVLLTGHTADDLWSGGETWLTGLLADRRFAEAAVALARAIGMRARGRSVRHGPRSSLLRLFREVQAVPRPRPWLTPRAEELLLRSKQDLHEQPASAAGDQIARAIVLPHHLAMLQVTDIAAEDTKTELRRPFRDRRLVELLLAVPPHLLYRPGESKRLLRRALADRLPPEVLQRRAITSTLSLALRGLTDRARTLVRDTLLAPEAVWPRYVRTDWLWGRAEAALENPRGGVDALVLWHCYSLERWLRNLEG